MSRKGLPLDDVLESVRPGVWGSDVATEERPIPVRVVRNGDISEDRRVLADDIPKRWVSEKELCNSRVTDRDTLLVGSGYIGKSARLGDIQFEEPVIASNFVRIVSPNDQTDPSWLFWLLGLDSATNYMRRVSAGTSLKNLPTSFFKEWKIPYHPPLEKQKHIASVLDSVEEAIEQTENVINKTEQLRDSLLHELLTRGLPGRHKERKEIPGLGAVPATWQVLCLSDVADVRFSSVDKKILDNEIPVHLCNYTDVYYNRYIYCGIDFMSATANSKEIERWSLKQEDVLFTKDSETPDDIGVPAFIVEDMPNVLCGYHLGLARPNLNVIKGKFLAEVLGSKIYRKQFTRITNGVTRFGLTLEPTKSIPVIVPSLEEQEKISKYLILIDHTYRMIEIFVADLKKLETSLSTALLTNSFRSQDV